MTPLSFETDTLDTRETRGFAAEVKFVVDPGTAAAISQWARFELRADRHGTGPWSDDYRITSVYFDTAGLDVLARRASFGRAKYRVRRYGTEQLAFLERKLRTKQLLAKRRTRVPLSDLALLDDRRPDATCWDGDWFRRRVGVRGLLPACQLTYDRTARILESPLGTSRLTIDRELRAAPAHSGEPCPGRGQLVDDGLAIVELKYRLALPSVFKRLIEEFSLSPVRISKYRLGQAALGRAPGKCGGPPAENRPQMACA